jgi:hypothetical protein
MEEGKPTGITREDVHNLDQVQFEGQLARIFHAATDTAGDVEHVVLSLDAGGRRLTLYGYFRGSEFMEVDREPLD